MHILYIGDHVKAYCNNKQSSGCNDSYAVLIGMRGTSSDDRSYAVDILEIKFKASWNYEDCINYVGSLPTGIILGVLMLDRKRHQDTTGVSNMISWLQCTPYAISLHYNLESKRFDSKCLQTTYNKNHNGTTTSCETRNVDIKYQNLIPDINNRINNVYGGRSTKMDQILHFKTAVSVSLTGIFLPNPSDHTSIIDLQNVIRNQLQPLFSSSTLVVIQQVSYTSDTLLNQIKINSTDMQDKIGSMENDIIVTNVELYHPQHQQLSFSLHNENPPKTTNDKKPYHYEVTGDLGLQVSVLSSFDIDHLRNLFLVDAVNSMISRIRKLNPLCANNIEQARFPTIQRSPLSQRVILNNNSSANSFPFCLSYYPISEVTTEEDITSTHQNEIQELCDNLSIVSMEFNQSVINEASSIVHLCHRSNPSSNVNPRRRFRMEIKSTIDCNSTLSDGRSKPAVLKRHSLTGKKHKTSNQNNSQVIFIVSGGIFLLLAILLALMR